MSEGPPASGSSPEPSTGPLPWAPLDPPSTPSSAPPDRWLPDAPVHPPFAGGTAPGIASRSGVPATASARRTDERPGRRVVTGMVLVAALLLGGAGYGAYASLRDDDRPQAEQADPDAWYAGDGVEEAPQEAGPVPQPTHSATPAATPSTGPGRDTVVYEVTGKGRVDILYSDANGESVWLDGVRLPWRARIRTDHRDQAMVQASRTGDNVDAIACSLTINGGAPVTEEITGAGWRANCYDPTAG
ncbi:MmpS family transport accessory protein [Micromonospora sp. WMMD812]|uniref:MmpS family transport accessory protein n=1 Tax=Micromonospora sp. WMMD812 TaxID=3015152 RepID=UPI00248AEE0F|nr:MmpS family transport accessory protein [Micromonospora sp. WMMD812]WBB66434.1 MmpS family transport accessory protein [Micromonospora sp. WMMD812]